MIVIVSGLPGSGKSFFASRLAAVTNALYFNSDKIRAERDAKGKYSFKDRLSIYLYIADQTGKAVDKGQHVVVDATFYHHAMRDLFIELAAMHQTPIFMILVEADEALIRERLSKPREFSEADFGVYESLKEQFEKIDMPCLRLKSGTDNIEDMIKQAKEYISKAHDGN
ncbi:MAG: ATP-binding protein [Dyadobacter sp.]|uniref:AAA family ATPase n=1 Tax=Dyadobacter sp. TaxID=1914288 RepID=UPI003266EACF